MEQSFWPRELGLKATEIPVQTILSLAPCFVLTPFQPCLPFHPSSFLFFPCPSIRFFPSLKVTPDLYLTPSSSSQCRPGSRLDTKPSLAAEGGNASFYVEGQKWGAWGWRYSRAIVMPWPQGREPSGYGGSCRGHEGWLGQRKTEGKKGRQLGLAAAPLRHKMALLSFTRTWVLE